MIDVIDMVLLYQQKYNEFHVDPDNTGHCNPYEFYKNADDYLGWREVCVQFLVYLKFLTQLKTDLTLQNMHKIIIILNPFMYGLLIGKKKL